jgi:DNA-binding transcriptional LysR family regulator
MIKKLEEEFDIPLFYRSADGLELTEYGELLKNYCISILEQYQLIFDKIRLLKDNSRVNLSVGYSEGIFNMLPKNFMSKFMMEYPNINITFKRYSDINCEQALLSREVDLCLCTAPYNNIMFRSLLHCKARIFAVIHKDHPLAAKESISLYDLQNERVIALNQDTKHYYPFMESLKAFGVYPKLFINPSETDIQFDLCNTNMAIGFFSGNHEHMPENVVLVRIRDLTVYSHYHILALHDINISDAMVNFTESVQKAIENGLNSESVKNAQIELNI